MLKIRLIPPTLDSMAMNTISLELWKQLDIVSEIKYLFHDKSVYSLIKQKKWSKIRESVVEKMPHLPFPDILKQKMKEVVEMIGLRIKVWLEEIICCLTPNNIPDSIRLISLKSDGGIDKKKTTTSIFKAVPNMDAYHRYRLGCMNCLEDDVRSIWEDFPDEEKNIILGVKSGLIRRNCDNDIVIYWSCFISQAFDFLYRRIDRDTRRSDNINDYFIWYSIWQCNSVAFQYFWEKLSEEEKRNNIVEYALELSRCIQSSVEVINELLEILVGDSVEICNFLGSQMDEVHFKEMVRQDPYLAMQFWFWCQYWHDGFISLDSLWYFIPPTHFRKFLITFVRYRILHPSESEFFVRKHRLIFRELWETTPNNIKRGFFENVANIEYILDSFIITADVENFQLIFDDATVDERKEIIHHSFSRERFVSILEVYCSHSRISEDDTTERSLTEEEIDDFLQDILSSFKEVKGDLWPLLNNLNKWKTGTTS